MRYATIEEAIQRVGNHDRFVHLVNKELSRHGVTDEFAPFLRRHASEELGGLFDLLYPYIKRGDWQHVQDVVARFVAKATVTDDHAVTTS